MKKISIPKEAPFVSKMQWKFKFKKKNESIFMNFNLIKVTKITKWKCPRERDGMLVTNLVVSILKKYQSNQIETNAILLAKEIVQNECGECLKVNFLH